MIKSSKKLNLYIDTYINRWYIDNKFKRIEHNINERSSGHTWSMIIQNY